MSVYKLKKKSSKVEYLVLSSDLRKTVMAFTRPFPVSYEKITVDSIVGMVISINRNCFKAYSSFMGKDNVTKHDLKERRKYFHKAYVRCMTLMADLKYLYDRMYEGQNFYKARTLDRKFETMVDLINKLRLVLKEIMQYELKRKKKIGKHEDKVLEIKFL